MHRSARNSRPPDNSSVNLRTSLKTTASLQPQRRISEQQDGLEGIRVQSMDDAPPVMAQLREQNTAAERCLTRQLVDSGRRFHHETTASGAFIDVVELPPAYTAD